MDDEYTEFPASAECELCGKVIEDPEDAAASVTAFVDAKGVPAPGTIEYTGKWAHGACVDREETARND
jgi:hypothetical protein